MKRIHVNGWHRIGIVISILWITVGALYWQNRVDRFALDQAGEMYRLCRNAQTIKDNPDDCTKEMRATYTAWSDPQPEWQPLALRAFGPVLLGWLAVYAIVAVVKWIRRGFQRGPT